MNQGWYSLPFLLEYAYIVTISFSLIFVCSVEIYMDRKKQLIGNITFFLKYVKVFFYITFIITFFAVGIIRKQIALREFTL